MTGLRGRVSLVVATVVVSFTLPASRSATVSEGQAPLPATADVGFVPGEILVELHPSASAQARTRLGPGRQVLGARTGLVSLDTLADRFSVREMRALVDPAGRLGPPPGRPSRLSHFYHLKLAPGHDLLETLEAYRRDPSVRTAQLNYIYTPDLVPNDPHYGSQYAHQVTAAETGWGVERGDPSIVIAVIGTGVEATHPDLASHLVAGWDFVENDNDPSPTGDDHETAVAGVAAAVTDNGIGIAGACWNCGIMPLKIDYTTVQVAQAVGFAVANGARIVNMSFGNYDPNKYGPDTAVETVIDEGFAAGVVMVATAGNDSISTMRFPGALPNVIGVASTDSSDQRAGFSNYGSWVDVAAPGLFVLSTTFSGTYTPVSGTSFSAPYVAGLAGLILSKDPAMSPATVRLIVEYTADRIAVDRFIGSGRVNVARALQQNGPPVLAAVIKSPLDADLVISGILTIQGTALGDSFLLEYKPEASSTWTAIGSGPQTIDGTLGSLDVGPLDAGLYDLRLTALSGAAQAQDQITIYVGGNYQTGWPQMTSAPVISPPTLSDLDHDGDLEVIVGSNNGRVFVWRHDGTLLPGWPKTVLGSYVFASPAVGDLDGDGDDEIVVTNYGSAYVNAWHHDGASVSGFPRFIGAYGTDQIRGSVALVELDGLPGLEMVAGTQGGAIHVLKAVGVPEAPGWPVFVDFNLQTTPAVGDIDHDGQMEIVVRQWNYLYAFNADGSLANGWPRYAPGGHTSPVLGDIDNDGTIEIVDAERQVVTAHRGDGSVLFSRSVLAFLSYSNLSLGDLDRDGRLETFVGADNGRVFGLSPTGSILAGWPVLTSGDVDAAPLVVDMNGDGHQEIVAASTDGFLHIWNADGTRAMSPIGLGSAIYVTPAAGDLDGDGDIELVAGTVDGRVHVLDLPGAWDPDLADWPKFQADPSNTGHFRFSSTYGDRDGDGDPDHTDCAPQDPSIHHGAIELCNGIDEDCTDVIDDPFDLDRDGHTTCVDDCDDSHASVHPEAPQICDGLNNDCDDPSWPEPLANDRDDDGDGAPTCAGDCNDALATVGPGFPQICDGLNNDCTHPSWPSTAGTNETDDDGDDFSECGGDCDDTRGDTFPNATQLCDGVNNNCNNPIWPSISPAERDVDRDGFMVCEHDCDDGQGTVYPGAPQLCDGLHNDCDDNKWPRVPENESDGDGDGWRLCSAECDDTRPSVYPGATQVCGDALNNDCLHPSWPSLSGTNEVDDDGDTYTECAGDCDDDAANTYAGAPQICDGINTDCSYPGWPAVPTNELDVDGDGYLRCTGVLPFDCFDGNPNAWSRPGDVQDLVWVNDFQLRWGYPVPPGGNPPFRYSSVRSTSPADFMTDVICLATSGSFLAVAEDEEIPAEGAVFYYLVRAGTQCGYGPWGFDSSGAQHTVGNCP